MVWRFWPELTVLITIAVAFHSTIAGSAHFPYDAEFFHYPLLRDVQELLGSGTPPSWDAFSYGGIPLLANAQSAWSYPPHLLMDGVLAALGAPLTEHTLDLVAIAHVAVAGLGTAAAARARGLGAAAAAFAGVFIVLAGYTVAQTQHVGMTETYAWIPFSVLVIDRLATGVTARRVVALGVLVAIMFTAGFLPLMAAVLVALLGIALARVSGARTALLGTVCGIAFGMALATAMLAPVIGSLSAFVPEELHGALSTSWLLTAILPNVFGHWNPPGGFTGIALTNSYFYIGGAAIIVLPLALSAGREAVVEAGLVLVLLLASFGAIGQWVANIIQGFPSVGPAWRPEDVAYVAAVPLGLLLARGLARPPSKRQLIITSAAVLMLAAVPFAADHRRDLHFLIDAPVQTAITTVAVAAMMTAAAVAAASRPRVAAAALALAALAGSFELAASVPGRYFVNWPGPATSAGPYATGDGSGVLAYLKRSLQPGERVIADVVSLNASWSGFPPIWHLPDINGFQPEFSKYLLARVRATGAVFHSDRSFPVTPIMSQFLDETDVRYVVLPASHDLFARTAGFKRVYADAGYHVYRNDARMRRAYAVNASCLRARGTLALTPCRSGPLITAKLTSTNTRTFVIAGREGVPLMITGEPWYPGWHASTRHGPLAVRRVGYMAAVSVPAGVSVLTMAYSTPYLVPGLVISALALLGAVAVVWRSRGAAGSAARPLRGRRQTPQARLLASAATRPDQEVGA